MSDGSPLCAFSGLGVMGNLPEGPARCTCGAIVFLHQGQIPYHSAPASSV